MYTENTLIPIIQVISRKDTPFYEVVLSYYRARNKLSSAEHDVHVLQKDYQRYKDLVWELRPQKLTVQVIIVPG